MSTPRNTREAQHDISAPRDIREPQSVSSPRNTREALSDITNVIGMLTIFSYATFFEISQYLLEATPAIMEGYPILDEASRKEGGKEHATTETSS
jgi:hypothetical protein